MKSHAARLVCLLVLFATLGSWVWAQSDDDVSAGTKILALEHAWNQAEALGDLRALDALFDNALLYVDYDGQLMTKAEFLSQVKSTHVQQVVTQSMTVHVFGQTAIVSGTYQSSERKNGKPIVRHGRFIDTWIYKDSTWVCVAAQATPIPR